jgi:hypothetical protein
MSGAKDNGCQRFRINELTSAFRLMNGSKDYAGVVAGFTIIQQIISPTDAREP